MDDEIKTVDASEDVVSKKAVEEKPKRKYTRRAKTENVKHDADEVKYQLADKPLESNHESSDVKHDADEVNLLTISSSESNDSKEDNVDKQIDENKLEDTIGDNVISLEEGGVPILSADPIPNIPVGDLDSANESTATPDDVSEDNKSVEKNETYHSAKIDVKVDWDKAVNQFLIFKKQVSIYRAPNSIAKGRPFVGRVQIVENTNDLYVKVRYVRSGLGATYGYAKKSQITQIGCEVGKAK